MFQKIKARMAAVGGFAIVIGLVTQVTGIEIASADIDKVMTAISVVMFYYPKFHDYVVAKFGKKAE